MENNKSYGATVEQIETDDTSGQGPIPANDISLIASTQINGKDSDSEWSKRDKLYTRLLKKYISEYESKAKWKKWYKLAFFIVTLLLGLSSFYQSLIYQV